MGFINNHKDAFLPNNHPWDDNITTYSVPTQSAKKKLSELSYDDLNSMLDEMSYQYKNMPMCQAKVSLKEKMMAVIQEVKQRDDLEEATAQERGDAFEQPLDSPLIENESTDVPSPPFQPVSPDEPLFNDSDDMDMGDDDLDMFEDGGVIEDELYNEEEEDEDDLYDDEVLEEDYSNTDNTTNFLMAALIVVVLIAITKK